MSPEASAAVSRAADEVASAQDFSGLIRVQADGFPVFERSYGLANRSDRIPNRPHTRFPIASGCKIFTGVAINQLVERGRLSFQARLGDCLDVPLPALHPSVTVHHLLTHTSGIPDYHDEESGEDYEKTWRTTPMYCMRKPADFLPLLKGRATKFEPGDRFSYCDAGYILLGLLVEQASGKSFPRYIESEIFGPCGMEDSGYFSLDRLPDHVAHGYIEDRETGEWRSNLYSVPVVGGSDGGAFCTGTDVARFWEGLFSNRLLQPGSLDLLLTPHVATADEPPSTHYGYGVWLGGKDDGGILYVCGWDPGVSFLSAAHRRGELTVTLLGNTNRSLWPIHDAILRVL